MNILVVDDEPTTRLLLRRFISRAFPCTVIEAESGLDALSLLERIPCTMALLDLGLPCMDGIEVLQAIRRYAATARLPVVIMTADRNEQKVHQLIELGVSGYLIKPLEAGRVIVRLQQVIDTLPDAAPATPATGSTQAFDPPAPLLVAAGDPDVRRLVASAIGSSRLVVEAGTGVAALELCRQVRPAIVLAGEGLGIVDAGLLLHKLRRLPEMKSAAIFALATGDGGAPNRDPADIDGVISPAMGPEALLGQLDAKLVALRA
jgi:two-component system chemotaxis response regulator CheY